MLINLLISALIVLLCVVGFMYNRKTAHRRTVKKLTAMVEKQTGELLAASNSRDDAERAQIVINYLRNLERKVAEDNKKARKLEFRDMVTYLYADGYVKKREMLKKYLDGLETRLGL